MSYKRATNFVLVVLAISLLSGCNPNEPVPSEQDQPETAWEQNGSTYSYQAKYERPNGFSEDIFTITLDESGVVTAAEAIAKEPGTKHDEGLARFNQALPSVIVGKNLSELGEFDTLGQYSLTTDAFNEAVKELQSQVSSAT